MTMRKIVGNYGIIARSGNYTVIREVPFNVGKENEYIKDMVEGFYGTFIQAIIGMRKMIHRDGEHDYSTLNEAIQLIKDIDADIIKFMNEHKESVYKMHESKDEAKNANIDEDEEDEEDENINGDEL